MEGVRRVTYTHRSEYLTFPRAPGATYSIITDSTRMQKVGWFKSSYDNLAELQILLYFINGLEKLSPATKPLPAVYSSDKAYNFIRREKKGCLYLRGSREERVVVSLLSAVTTWKKWELRSTSCKQKPETSFSSVTSFANYCDSLITGFWCDCSMTRLQQCIILAWRATLVPSAS